MSSVTSTLEKRSATNPMSLDNQTIGVLASEGAVDCRPCSFAAQAVSIPNTTWFADYVALTKPRILMMILLTVGAGAVCVPGFTLTAASALTILGTLVGTMFVAASASVINQVTEKNSDALMKRTRNRPLPAARLTEFEATVFGLFCAALGLMILAATTNGASTLVAFMTWLLYVGVYTPMKMVSAWNTAVGTLPGAMPVLIGWCALDGSLADWRVWALTGIVVLWQFPHFMSIAWLYRNEYAAGGYRMWTTQETSGRVAGHHAWIGALALIAISVTAVPPTNWLGWLLCVVSFLVGFQQLVAAIGFHRDRNDKTARKLLRSSLMVLPLLMLCAVLQSFFG